MEIDENGVILIEQHDKSEMEKFDHLSSEEDGNGMLEETSFSCGFLKSGKTYVKKAWPKVESALEEYGISCELNLVECSMTVSTTGKTRHAKFYCRARFLIWFLARRFPARQAIKILNDKVDFDCIMIGLQDGGICSKHGIEIEQYHKRRGRLIGPKKSTLNALCKLTGCYIIVYGHSVFTIGSFEGVNEVSRIVEDCIQNGVHPASHIWRLRRIHKVGDKKIAKERVHKIRVRSIIEELIKTQTQFICCEHIYTKIMEAQNEGQFTHLVEMIQDTDVLEKLADKFSSSDSPEVHENVGLALRAIIRFGPPGLSAKISRTSFIGRLLRHSLEDSRPKHVLVKLLTVCISLLDHRRLKGTANPEIVACMLEILVLLTVGGEAVEKELIRLGAVQRILDLFFKYPYNNFVHHHIENIIVSCLESKNAPLVQNLLCECDLVGKILQEEKNFTLEADSNKPTVPVEGRSPPRIGNIGHLTRISNKIIHLGNNNSEIQAYQQENREWTDWHTNILSKRNEVENVHLWGCGHPTSLQNPTGGNAEDDYRHVKVLRPTLSKIGSAAYIDWA